ncbi:hypothetical protein HOO68_05620 [Candidatus Gracilibacteria bacterium]|nr:hypothetical protein [Candidatus Gracilibacteria bacterium]
MLTRIVGFIVILVTLYLMLVFVAPNFADQYGDKDINAKIRNIKNQSLDFASGSDSPVSLFEKIKGSTTLYIEDTKNTVKGIEATVNTKVIQAQEAKVAVENAYSGVVDATQKIKALTGTGK